MYCIKYCLPFRKEEKHGKSPDFVHNVDNYYERSLLLFAIQRRIQKLIMVMMTLIIHAQIVVIELSIVQGRANTIQVLNRYVKAMSLNGYWLMN